MGTEMLGCNHGYEDRGLAIGRYIFMSNKDKDKGKDKDKDTDKIKKQRCTAAAGRRTKIEGQRTDTKVA